MDFYLYVVAITIFWFIANSTNKKKKISNNQNSSEWGERMQFLIFDIKKELKTYAVQFVDLYGSAIAKKRESLGMFNFNDKKEIDAVLAVLTEVRTKLYIARNDNGHIIFTNDEASMFQETLFFILDMFKKGLSLQEDETSALAELIEVQPHL